ncbi:MAG: MFS transporter [Vulcanisaeta sp.]
MSVKLFVSVLVPFLMSAFCVFSIVYLFPELSTAFHVGVAALSLLVTLSFIGGAVGGVFLGMVADAYGRRVGLALSVLIFSLFTLMAGFAGGLLELYVFWFLVGFGVNAENGITYAVVIENWRSGRGLMGGVLQGIYFIGIVLDALVSGVIRDWRLVLISIGATSLALSLPLIMLVPETAGRIGLGSVGYGELFRGSLLIITVLSTVLVSSAFLYTIPLVSLAPTYLSAIKPPGLSTWLIALPLVGAASYVIAGYASDIYGRAKTLTVLSTIALVSSVALLLMARSYPGYVTIPVVLAYFSSSIFAYLGVWISELYPMRVRATASNFAFFLGRLLGGVGPPIVAALFSYDLGVGLGYVLTISAALALASTLILSRFASID